jgi:putative Ca2+/H+ antiporter (TMEM165/GDT1 family)
LEALLTTFLAAGLAEWGDKTQLLVVALAARFGRTREILIAAALAALANAFIASAGGMLINQFVAVRQASLLVAVALLFAGVAGLITRTAPEAPAAPGRSFVLTAALALFAADLGDKSQFLTFALAARYDSLVLAAFGAAAGIMVASAPAALLGAALPRTLPVKPLRIAIAFLFLLAGFFVAVNALRLV